VSADTEYPETREVYVVRDADDEEANWFLVEDAAFNWCAEREADGPEGLTVEPEEAQVCQGCGDTRVALDDGRCFFCYDAAPDGVEMLDREFRRVASRFNFATAFWSLNEVYDRYDGLSHEAVAEVPDR
jgi:hypothetical protein